jgi:hypothetical protein
MSALPYDPLDALAQDMEQGRPLDSEAVARLTGRTEHALRSAARVAYPLTAPDQALQLAMRDVVDVLYRQARGQGGEPPDDNLVWRLLQRPATD